jgi:hypothetical protein
MGQLIPGQALIYERANGVVYARYRDPPHNKIERWIIGGDPVAVGEAQGELLPYSEWLNMCELSLKYPTLKKQLDKAVDLYLLLKEKE